MIELKQGYNVFFCPQTQTKRNLQGYFHGQLWIFLHAFEIFSPSPKAGSHGYNKKAVPHRTEHALSARAA
jgi:hypothetical protein